jgi:hypothetical protein
MLHTVVVVGPPQSSNPVLRDGLTESSSMIWRRCNVACVSSPQEGCCVPVSFRSNSIVLELEDGDVNLKIGFLRANGGFNRGRFVSIVSITDHASADCEIHRG